MKHCVNIIHLIEGEVFRFHVEPQSFGQERYLVDLEELDGNGQCSCPDFQCRKLPQWHERQSIPKSIRDDLRPLHCKHITACRNYFVDRAIQLFGENEAKVREAMAAARGPRLEYVRKSNHAHTNQS